MCIIFLCDSSEEFMSFAGPGGSGVCGEHICCKCYCSCGYYFEYPTIWCLPGGMVNFIPILDGEWVESDFECDNVTCKFCKLVS